MAFRSIIVFGRIWSDLVVLFDALPPCLYSSFITRPSFVVWAAVAQRIAPGVSSSGQWLPIRTARSRSTGGVVLHARVACFGKQTFDLVTISLRALVGGRSYQCADCLPDGFLLMHKQATIGSSSAALLLRAPPRTEPRWNDRRSLGFPVADRDKPRLFPLDSSRHFPRVHNETALA